MSLLSCHARKQGIWSLWRRAAPSRRPRRATPAAMEREYPFDCQRTWFFDSLTAPFPPFWWERGGVRSAILLKKEVLQIETEEADL